MAGYMAIACSLACMGMLSLASADGEHRHPGITPARYKLVDPAASVLKYKVEGAYPKIEVVRKAVAAVAPGCSIVSCSDVYEECGWCEKDGGFAVGYTKEEEIVGNTLRATMTLGKECKGIFVYNASKCPGANKNQLRAAELSLQPEKPVPTEVPERRSVHGVQYISVPVHDPTQVLDHHPAATLYQHTPIHMPRHGPHKIVPILN